MKKSLSCLKKDCELPQKTLFQRKDPFRLYLLRIILSDALSHVQ